MDLRFYSTAWQVRYKEKRTWCRGDSSTKKRKSCCDLDGSKNHGSCCGAKGWKETNVRSEMLADPNAANCRVNSDWWHIVYRAPGHWVSLREFQKMQFALDPSENREILINSILNQNIFVCLSQIQMNVKLGDWYEEWNEMKFWTKWAEIGNFNVILVFLVPYFSYFLASLFLF